jgi:hypothetical protein
MICYRKGLKYQIVNEPYIAKTPIVGYDINIRWIRLHPDGTLILDIGYGWDGSSGPTINSSKDKQASAEHDAFYKLIRLELLPKSIKDLADQRYMDKCIEDGLLKARARIRYSILEKFGDPSTRPSRRQRIYYAP